MSDLKPCPFCGGKAILAAYSGCSGRIVCVRCHFRSDKYWDEPMTSPELERKKWKEIVTDAWNRRVADE